MLLEFENLIITEHSHSILLVMLAREHVLNAINKAMVEELLVFWNYLHEAHHYRCIVLTGAGVRSFSVGADLKERQQYDDTLWAQHIELQAQMMRAMVNCPIPVIAAINGYAYGGGLELALAADFAYAANNAQFSQSEVTLGIIPGAMGTQNLPRAVGVRRAKELSFSGKVFAAEAALNYGVVNAVYKQAELLRYTLEVAETIAANAPLAVSAAKRSINQGYHRDIASGYDFELEQYHSVISSQDRHEGIAAFNAKRKPNFKGK